MEKRNSTPKVSIVCISYNHESYIRQTLEGFVGQQTNFDFEVIVGDDCSRDSTAKIIQEFADRYSQVVKPILRKKNVGSTNNLIDCFKATTGQYVAVCDGDDYWTDMMKLQRQSDFLDNNSGYSMCFHSVSVTFEGHEKKDEVYPDVAIDKVFTTNDLLRENFIQTNSVMYRRKDYEHIPNNVMPLDWYLHIYHAIDGFIGFTPEVMSTYRRHRGGIWWDAHDNPIRLLQNQGAHMLNLYVELLKLFPEDPEKRWIIYYRISDLFLQFSKVDQEHAVNLVQHSIDAHPELLSGFLQYQAEELASREENIHQQRIELATSEQSLRKIEKDNRELRSQINSILQSKSWKMVRKVAQVKMKGRSKNA